MTKVSVKHIYLKTFFIALAGATLLFLPAMIYDHGYFIFVGDFNSQQIPFYMNAHDAIRKGEWGWNWYTDLGANFIGSYTFYLLGSPFFWLTIPFPRAFVPYMMGPLLMLKFATAALFSCMYFRRYVKHEYLAILGGLVYAFSGFSIYNIFFNHFHEAIVFFPLMLISLDDWMEKGTRGTFALSVALNALINYFFFFGEVVFVIIYYFVRLFTGGYKKSLDKFLGILIEAILGFLMSFVLMVPSAISVLQNSRVNNFPSGFNVWLYYNRFRNYSILNNFLFPPELPSKQVLIPDGNAKWTSLSAYLPLFSVTGVVAFIQTKRKDWLSYLIKVLVIMAIVPGLNSLFVAFNASYYARWYYMLTLMLCLATIRALDHQMEKRLTRANWWVLALTVAISAALAFTPQMSNGSLKRIGLYDDTQLLYFIVIAGTAILSLLVHALILPEIKKNLRRFTALAMAAILIFGVIYGNFFIFWGKGRSYDTKKYIIPHAIEGESLITIPDKEEVMRIDVDDSLINMGMFWNISCMRAFHSIVPASIMDFYVYIGEKRDVSSKIPEAQYAVRGLLGIHWYFDRIGSSDDFGDINGTETLMPGYTYYGDMAGYHVWENDYYIPFGFTYDRFILRSELDNVPEANRAAMMLHSVCLEDETAYKYMDVMEHSRESTHYVCSPITYENDCERHRLETVTNMKYTRTGLTCESNFNGNRFLYFGIPYDDGWHVYVDHREVPIEKVNVGFIGFKVTGGEHQIEFVYRTPGLTLGMAASAVSIIGFVFYWIFAVKADRRDEEEAIAADTEETAQELILPDDLAKEVVPVVNTEGALGETMPNTPVKEEESHGDPETPVE